MIAVNVMVPDNFDPEADGYDIMLAGIVDDYLDINNDIESIIECLDHEMPLGNLNSDMYYTVYMKRTSEPSDPVPEMKFSISQVIYNNKE